MQDAALIDFNRWKVPGLPNYNGTPSSGEKERGLGIICTRSYLDNAWSNLQKFVEDVAISMGCQIRDDACFIDSDARDGFADYFAKIEAFFDLYLDGIRS